MLKKIIQILWGLFLFTFPFSIRFLVYEEAAYRFGNFNPWVSGFVYLPEVLLIVVFILWILQDYKITRLQDYFSWPCVLLLLFLINAGVVTFLNGDVVLLGFFLLRLAEAVMVYLMIQGEIFPIKTVVKILLGAALFQIALGYLQWKLNHSLGLTFLGEAIIGPDVLGVAKIDLTDGLKQIRPYGTFLHPNILAGYLLIILFSSFAFLKKQSRWLWLIILGVGIYLTHSHAAWLAGLLGLAIYFALSLFPQLTVKRWLSALLLMVLAVVNVWFFFNSQSVNTQDISVKERLEQNVISRNMFDANPFGVGVSNFTLEMELYPDCGSNSGSKLLPWEFQPVHNTYFLILNETGIQGLLIILAAIVLLFYRYWKQGAVVSLFALLLLAPFDHFLWDSFVGLMLVGLVMGFWKLSEKT